ncbi:uncharacterized protein LOC113672371, partial [Paramuricea clavata]
MKSVVFMVVLHLVFFFIQTSECSLHASCKIDWSFGINCTTVNTKIVSQIKNWTSDENCKKYGGEKCLYTLISSTATEIKATHETPAHHYVDDLSFSFTTPSQGNCAVHGYSTSETWYAVLDDGTNYCNLHNLITGSSLDKAPGYKE